MPESHCAEQGGKTRCGFDHWEKSLLPCSPTVSPGSAWTSLLCVSGKCPSSPSHALSHASQEQAWVLEGLQRPPFGQSAVLKRSLTPFSWARTEQGTDTFLHKPQISISGRESRQQRAKLNSLTTARGWAGELGKARCRARGAACIGGAERSIAGAQLLSASCPTPGCQGSGHGLGKRDVNGTDGRRGLLTANCPLWLRL